MDDMNRNAIPFRIEIKVVGFDPLEKSQAALDIGAELEMRPQLETPMVIDDLERNRVLIQTTIRDITPQGAAAQVMDQLYEIINVTVEQIDGLEIKIVGITSKGLS